MIVSLAAQQKMHMKQYDIATSYRNGELDETIYMEIPKQFSEVLQEMIYYETDNEIKQKAKIILEEYKQENKVYLLKQSFYGLRQVGRNWYKKLKNALFEKSAKPTESDNCLFKLGEREDSVLIAVYVDDILVVSINEKEIQKFGKKLSQFFEVKDLGNASYRLGVAFERKKDKIELHQRGYILELLDKFEMSESHPVPTPIEICIKLTKSESVNEGDKCLSYRERYHRGINLIIY